MSRLTFNNVILANVSILVAAAFVLEAFSHGQTARLTNAIKNPGGILSVAFSPDGELIACGGENTLRIYNSKSAALVRVFSEQEATVNSVVFSPDGRTLATGDDGGVARLWNVQTGRQEREMRVYGNLQTSGSHDYRVLCVRFSHEGTVLATGSGGFDCRDCTPYGEVKLWEVQTGKSLSDFQPRKGYVWSIAFSPVGGVMATASAGSTVEIWNAETGRVKKELYHKGQIFALAFSADGDHLISAGEDKTVTAWETRTWKVEQRFKGFKSRVLSVAVTNDGRIMAIGEYDDEIRIGKIGSTTMNSCSSKRQSSVNSIAISPTGDRLALGVADGTLLLLSLP